MHRPAGFVPPPSIDELAEMAEAALRRIPEPFRGLFSRVAVRVEELTTAEIAEELGLDSPDDLLGLYTGVPLSVAYESDPIPHTDTVFLYRRPIVAWWRETGEDLGSIVYHVIVHEFGHHLGLSDDDMEQLEAQA